MNRRDALKRLVGTTVAVAVALPFAPDANGYITDDTDELDRRAWWRENFTIQKVEYAKDLLGANLMRVVVTQNGRSDRSLYASVVLAESTTFDEMIKEIETAIAHAARIRGWVKRQNRRHIA